MAIAEEQQNIQALFDILLSVQKYQLFYNHQKTVGELLELLKKREDLERLVNISYWISFNPRNYFIHKFCKKYNLYFNSEEDLKRVDSRFKNSKKEILETEQAY